MNADTTEAVSKRDRQRQRRRERAKLQQRDASRRRRQRLARNVALAVVALAAVVGLAFLLGGGTDVTLGVAEARVEEGDEPLAPLDPSATDPAIGQTAPTVTGEDFAGQSQQIGAGAGRPQAITFMAHWCPHCQEEVPEVVDWVADGALPDDVELVAVSSRHEPARTNWPPDEWLEDEGWPASVLVDASDAAADAYGLTATPYWVFLDADGEVVSRTTGRITRAQFEETTAALSGS